jgi:catechol 2,3-dioxygenase-like lactoylglutathione lyase family enzyme
MHEGFKIGRLDHVNVTAPEELEDETLTWYRDTLGLEEIEKPRGTRPRGAWFQIGDAELHVSIDEHNPHKTSHFGLIVDDYDAVIGRLRSARSHIEQADVIPGRHRFYTRDPAGNRVEIAHLDEDAK